MIEHRYATRRLWRYLNPQIDLFLSMAEGVPPEHQIERARAEEGELRSMLEEHWETCEVCNGEATQIAV
ncbi:MAG TPA: hypothetical protein VF018_08815 [Acidobacteriaceae bacterium]